MKKWLGYYDEEIKRKFYAEEIEVKIFYIVISSFGVLQREIYKDFTDLLIIEGFNKRQMAKNFIRRIIMQTCRESFEI
jgi:hypothetical protein